MWSDGCPRCPQRRVSAGGILLQALAFGFSACERKTESVGRPAHAGPRRGTALYSLHEFHYVRVHADLGKRLCFGHVQLSNAPSHSHQDLFAQ